MIMMNMSIFLYDDLEGEQTILIYYDNYENILSNNNIYIALYKKLND